MISSRRGIYGLYFQLWLLVDLEDFGMRTSGDKTCGEGSLTNMIEIKNFPADNNSTSVCVSKVFSKAQDILGKIHQAVFINLGRINLAIFISSNSTSHIIGWKIIVA